MNLPICGVKDFMGCNRPIENVEELYRCLDCGIAFHKECLRAHFGSSHAPHDLREKYFKETIDGARAENQTIQGRLWEVKRELAALKEQMKEKT